MKCGKLVPQSYRKPLEGVAPLANPAPVAALGTALDSQTAVLDRSQGRTADLIEAIDTCDELNAELMASLAKRYRWIRFPGL